MSLHSTNTQVTAAAAYYENVRDVLGRVTGTQMPAIEKAAGLVAATVERGGIVYAFGSGHSMCIAIELYFRAGGLACVDIVHDKTNRRRSRERLTPTRGRTRQRSPPRCFNPWRPSSLRKAPRRFPMW